GVASWQWLFLVNLPVCLGALVAGYLILPSKPGTGRRFDFPSALLNAVAFGCLILAVSGINDGNNALPTVTHFALAAIAFVLLVLRQLAGEAPLLPVALFRTRLFSLSTAAAICSFIAQ